MKKRLRVTLPEGWSEETDSRAEGILVFVRERSKSAGTLRMSLGVYGGGRAFPPSSEELQEMAIKHVIMQNLGRLDECSSGSCFSGNFATAVYWHREAPRSQIWFISNGEDLITVTHICRAEPDRTEVLEANMIAEGVEIVEE